MRILHAVAFLDDRQGGAGPQAIALAQCAQLRRRGHDAQLITTWAGHGPAPLVIEGVPVNIVRRVGTGVALRRWVAANAHSYDVVHLHLDAPQDWLIPALAKHLQRAQIAYVAQTHGRFHPAAGGWRRLATDSAGRRVLTDAAWRLVADASEREVVVRACGTDDQVTLLPDGVITSSPRPQQTSPTPPEGPLDVVMVADDDCAQDVMGFARAAVAALELGVDATFTVIGPPPEQARALRELIADADHLEGMLRQVDPLPRNVLAQRLRTCDIVAVPATDSQRCVVLLEALAAGTPVICSETSRLALTLRAHQAAAVVKAGEAALAQAMVRLIDDESLRRCLGEQGAATARELFDISDVTDLLERDYVRALAHRYNLPLTLPLTTDRSGDVAAPQSAPTSDLGNEPIGLPTLDGVERLLWISDDINEHRLAVWRRMADICDLTVAVLTDAAVGQWLVGRHSQESFHLVTLRSEVRAADDAPSADPARTLKALMRNGADAVVVDAGPSPIIKTATRWAKYWRIPVLPSGLAQVNRGGRLTLNSGRPTHVDLTARLPRQDRADSVDLRSGHHFLFVGALVAPCNADGLLRAFAMVANADDVLTISGYGPQRLVLQELASELAVGAQVRFADAVPAPQRAALFAQAQTVVLPFQEDVWTRELHEALSARCHVVVSNACRAAVAHRGDPGLFLTAPDTQSLAHALLASRRQWGRQPRRSAMRFNASAVSTRS